MILPKGTTKRYYQKVTTTTYPFPTKRDQLVFPKRTTKKVLPNDTTERYYRKVLPKGCYHNLSFSYQKRLTGTPKRDYQRGTTQRYY